MNRRTFFGTLVAVIIAPKVISAPFANFGKGTPAVLHGRETVMSLEAGRVYTQADWNAVIRANLELQEAVKKISGIQRVIV